MKVLVLIALNLIYFQSNGQQFKLPCPLKKGVIYKQDKYEADPGLVLKCAATIESNDTIVRASFNGVVSLVDSSTQMVQVSDKNYIVTYIMKASFVQLGQSVRIGQVIGRSTPKYLSVFTTYKEKAIEPWKVFMCKCEEYRP
ncbi:MAG: hypothetical protein EOO38_06180 [Cytophagaceae bacterium]|nr:MAG: hypothetical protein EOO38_06180 [Cytophagaceae bacterium]